MAEHKATIVWTRLGEIFSDGQYSRGHVWRFDGGIEVPASSSPYNVPLPWSVAAAVDPEEAFVAALSSCHMLWFLSIAAKRGFAVDSYRDEAVGIMAKDAEGKLAMTLVTLHPEVQFSGERKASDNELDELHHQAQAECFIARSVKTEVRCESVFRSS